MAAYSGITAIKVDTLKEGGGQPEAEGAFTYNIYYYFIFTF
jgi:hypothetical protein